MQSNQDTRRRAYWLRTLHEWHWVSAALCLLGMLLFSVTGITLNHAADIESRPKVVKLAATIDAPLLAELQKLSAANQAKKGKGDVPPSLQLWLKSLWAVDASAQAAEWSKDEVYISLPRPGGDAWVRIGLDDGQAEYERTDRGWISWLNDLHKGRNTGAAWSWFIDIFAAAALTFATTGLFILKMHAGNRPMTWPVVALGLLIPCVLALLFIH